MRELHASRMFIVTEDDAAAIRAAFDQAGEASAAVTLKHSSTRLAPTPEP
jgi:hypothetical protein